MTCDPRPARSRQRRRQSFFKAGRSSGSASRPHRLCFLNIEHIECFSQTSLGRPGNLSRSLFVDPVGRDPHRRCRGAAGRHTHRPARREVAHGRRRFGFRRGLSPARSGEGFWHFLLLRWLLVSPGDALMGSMVVNVSIALVRPDAWPRARSCRHGPRPGQGRNAASGSVAHPIRGLAPGTGCVRPSYCRDGA